MFLCINGSDDFYVEGESDASAERLLKTLFESETNPVYFFTIVERGRYSNWMPTIWKRRHPQDLNFHLINPNTRTAPIAFRHTANSESGLFTILATLAQENTLATAQSTPCRITNHLEENRIMMA
eukprot:TRINITY_DN14057_c0_g1_i1.p1 TRINITY_DN14057_c0_g1~~TRINITY_DN14057_c0_g1_i1.p1  ORF type:complete len:125 (-),score=7.78 TRINITY_DN14057_c0_g1_i1:34-408(-)